MKTISRYIMTLALLITAVTGAWAQEETLLTTITATSKDSYSETTPGVVTVTHDNSDIYGEYGWVWWAHAGSITVEAKEGYTITRCVFRQSSKTPVTVSSAPFKVSFIETANPSHPDQKKFMCQGDWKLNMNGVSSIEVYGYVPAPATDPDAIDVTTNAAEEGATFTEASFLMQTSDVTVNYELVRDMSVQMQAKVGDDPDKQPRYRVQWNGERWVPADLNPQQVQALFSLKDLIEDKTLNLTSFNDSIYAVDAEGNPIGDAMTFQNFTFAPGRYCVTVTAPQGIAYEGTTAPSNIFELYQGYEVTVPAGEYATFYKDEKLYVEDKDAELYTISSVTESEAVLSEAITVAPAETPLLVYNKSEQEKTFLLIPTTDDAPEVTPAKEFKGSITSVELNASSSTADYYALNGKAFVWVKDNITIGANKCWLQIGDQPAAARAMTRSITGGGDTTNMDDVRWQMEDGNYYDLQGRKVEKPNRKGIYIHNGQKVVVH